MALTIGSRLGPYEVVAAIGAGGMGEVYRARDTKLNRDVALKILLATVATDPERLARFAREAQVLAALNHPHIAHVYGIEDSTGVSALVMELVDGPTLADRIAEGPIPVGEALDIARQIVEALEAAHEQGIVHRDLKPANIKIRDDGTVKVLDFGLAKAFDTGAGSNPSVTASPTITTPAMMTGVGVILGTAAYMSPEQAKGRAADKRSDIWSFGCVLYEMLSGVRAFEGEDISDTLANVLKTEPDWNALPSTVPSHIRDLLRQSLQKDRKQRIGDIAVARYVLNAATPFTPMTAAAPPPPVKRSAARTAMIVGGSIVAAALLLAAGGWVALHLSTPAAPPVTRFAITPRTESLALTTADRDIAISADGTHIVYVGTGQLRAGQIFVRALNELDARPLAGTEGARWPFLSPDGHWVGFFGASGQLMKVSMTGGPAVALCTTPGGPRGASWETDDTIVFATSSLNSGLLSVSAGGGTPKVLTKPEPPGEGDHVFPAVLPGGRVVLFTIAGAQPENAQVAVLDLSTGLRKTLVRGGSHPAYLAPPPGSQQPGYLLYATVGSLRAVRFDAQRLETIGDSVPAVDQLLTSATSGAAQFAVSRTGALVFVPSTSGSATPAATRTLVWVTRQGREEPIKAPPRTYATARLSPDGAKAAVSIYEQAFDLWIWDLGRQTLERLTKDPSPDMSPVWTPDGRHIIWGANAGTPAPNIYRQAADGTGAPERLTTSSNAQFPTSISADGARLVMWENVVTTGGNSFDVSTLTLESSKGDRRAEPLLHTAAREANPELSPDGHWLAYESDESGKFEVYVRPFPNVDDGRTLVSTGGGTRSAWARTGRELFYVDADGFLTTVPVQTTGSTFKAGTPARLLSTKYFTGATTRGNSLRGYDVSADGRFLMIKDAPATDQSSNATPPSMVVVLNWLEELKQRIPSK
jgi:serine/threonine-protein kinase